MVEHVRIQLPNLPPALEGLRIAHITDTHFFREQIGTRMERVIRELAHTSIDLAFLTGDYMDEPGHEEFAAKHLATLISAMRPRLGFAGVFGNHDTVKSRAMFRKIAGVHWLENQWLGGEMALPEGLAIAGLGTACTHGGPKEGVECDGVALAVSREAARASTATVRLVLSHKHVHLPLLADMRVDVVFSGHTHGGQCRSPVPWNWRGARALVNSTDWPLHLTSGVMLHRRTLATVSRGMGETTLRVRAFCPMHLVVVELARGARPGGEPRGVVNVRPW